MKDRHLLMLGRLQVLRGGDPDPCRLGPFCPFCCIAVGVSLHTGDAFPDLLTVDHSRPFRTKLRAYRVYNAIEAERPIDNVWTRESTLAVFDKLLTSGRPA